MTAEAVPVGTEGFFGPLGDEESEGFWEGTAVGELRLQVCGACGRLRFPPRAMCPHCHSTERQWRAASGKGTIWSFVVAHPPLLPAYAPFAPYPVIVVTLDEGPALRMVGNLVTQPEDAINAVDPATIVIGEPVQVVFCRRAPPDGSSFHLPAWVRTDPQTAAK
jgi:uncharacterized OB-fold protein